jgi:hypothetical protein
MVTEFMDFLVDIYNKFNAHEHLQVTILETLIETIVLVCSDDGQINNSYLNMSLNDNEKVYKFIELTIQNVAARLKCNDSIVQDQFNLLSTLMFRDSQTMLTQLGVDFLINFGTITDPTV